eukprot:1428799-Alexandrium_andersonii.AAC.1
MASLSGRHLTSLGYKSRASGILVVLPSALARPSHPIVAWGKTARSRRISNYRTWKASGRMRMKRERIE